ncbi:Glucosamine-6-phosphate deaminase 1 [Symmachiella dynata]|uniref:Glucosamine-6-phosphate deaminase n=2 Tax=Symmachiella dynata TaxID=2527995 RepID=A0A517ZND2_9PLAN|nr:glucosamine-6-phosphate deaminase [Symmachiella dynata]QDT48391.1 Glucosamine-6-phosphate deaminase 1 [Symmachiella dynata]QDU43984.1 Glucosamine-6-phosphate deaminase 1 [Symmachiella dynata]
MDTNVVKRPRSNQSAQYLRQTKIPTLMFETSVEADKHVSLVIESLIRENNSAGTPTVLGLPTGSTPIGVYRELIRLHNEEDLDFSRVITFNLDEYYPMDPTSIHSYRRWMNETFFDHVNIPEENIHIPKGDIPREEVEAFCDDYERQIERAGGIDIQLLGIGRTGHIGFNEPGSSRESLTRKVTLDPVTRGDAADSFFGLENVPMEAITMGVGSILSAGKIFIMALGEHKAPVVKRAVEGEITEEVSASFLQKHPQAVFVVDVAAASKLTAVETPWIVGPVEWTPELTKRAVIGLSEKIGKPLLKLNRDDFMGNHLHDLLRHNGEAEAICMKIFDEFMQGICTHPADKEKQTVIVFSPHPDDDVISMGGTLITMVDQGHDVYIAYMTSGNIAVFDHDALRHIDYVDEYEATFGLATEETRAFHQRCRDSLATKQSGDPDTEELLNIKGLIRKTEATTAAIAAGVPREKLRFLDLPFYQTGKVTKRPIGEDDVHIVADLLSDLNPGQIYVAGDLSDPHGTHRMCAKAILAALEEVGEAVKPEVWLYRGAWQEYDPHEIDRVVPLSFELMHRKKLAIFRHESQKDAARFPGSDKREFWLRAEERTKKTADVYNNLGLPEFYGLEGFARWRGQL